MSEPVSITVEAEYIASEPDLQARLFIRCLANNNSVSKEEMAKLLHDEADRLTAQIRGIGQTE